MTTQGRGRVRLFAAGFVGFLLVLGISAVLRQDPAHDPVSAPDPRINVKASTVASPVSAVVQAPHAIQPGVRSDYIVQASSAALAKRAVEEVGGIITGDLGII